jgi:hypothetical protein
MGAIEMLRAELDARCDVMFDVSRMKSFAHSSTGGTQRSCSVAIVADLLRTAPEIEAQPTEVDDSSGLRSK